MEKINLQDKFAQFDDYWSPRIIAELNGQFVKLAKFKGKMVWHSHESEDELFQVIKGSIKLHFRDQTVVLSAGECLVVPRGVEHMPEAEEEAEVLLFEPMGTAHTGSTRSALSVDVQDQLWI